MFRIRSWTDFLKSKWIAMCENHNQCWKESWSQKKRTIVNQASPLSLVCGTISSIWPILQEHFKIVARNNHPCWKL